MDKFASGLLGCGFNLNLIKSSYFSIILRASKHNEFSKCEFLADKLDDGYRFGCGTQYKLHKTSTMVR